MEGFASLMYDLSVYSQDFIALFASFLGVCCFRVFVKLSDM